MRIKVIYENKSRLNNHKFHNQAKKPNGMDQFE